jgi:hypothetical protein
MLITVMRVCDMQVSLVGLLLEQEAVDFSPTPWQQHHLLRLLTQQTRPAQSLLLLPSRTAKVRSARVIFCLSITALSSPWIKPQNKATFHATHHPDVTF